MENKDPPNGIVTYPYLQHGYLIQPVTAFPTLHASSSTPVHLSKSLCEIRDCEWKAAMKDAIDNSLYTPLRRPRHQQLPSRLEASPKRTPTYLLFWDSEMTRPDYVTGQFLEIACSVSLRARPNEILSGDKMWHVKVTKDYDQQHQQEWEIRNLSAWSKQHHLVKKYEPNEQGEYTKSLIDMCFAESAKTLQSIEQEIVEMLEHHIGPRPDRAVVLLVSYGSMTDREYIRHHMPRLNLWLEHDARDIKQLKNFILETKQSHPKKQHQYRGPRYEPQHCALGDMIAARETYCYYYTLLEHASFPASLAHSWSNPRQDIFARQSGRYTSPANLQATTSSSV